MTIVHNKVSDADAPADPAKVGGPDWNEAHCYGAGALVPAVIFECAYNTTGDLYFDRHSPTALFGEVAPKNWPGLWVMPFQSAPIPVADGCSILYVPVISVRPLFGLPAGTNITCGHAPGEGPGGTDVLYLMIDNAENEGFDPAGDIRLSIQIWARVVAV